jgi:excisionase family DNA binding protein
MDLLTTRQAAELLHTSQSHLVKLLENGEIPFEEVGGDRRLRTADVLAYRAARAGERKKQLDELSRLSQEYEHGYR